jgi:Outer membrane protein beta-barrel domain
MKNHFITTLLLLCITGITMGQTKKPTTTTKKPTTTVKTTPPKTTTTTKTSPVVTTPVETQTTTTPPTSSQKTNTNTKTTTTTPSTTTTTQSSGPSKGKKPTDPKPEKVKEPKPEKVKEPKPEKVREPKPERVRTPRASSDEGGVKFGLRVEATQLVLFESGGSYDFSPGVNAGLFANIPFSEKVSIQPEVLYSMQVRKIDPVKTTTSSILVPVTFNFNLGSGNTKFVISPGGYANYYLSQSNSTGGFSVDVDLAGSDKIYYGVVLGLGAKINNKFLIEARGFYDLKNANNKSMISTIGIGYMF